MAASTNPQVNFRLTPEEFERTEIVAKGYGMTVPAFAKAAMLKAVVYGGLPMASVDEIRARRSPDRVRVETEKAKLVAADSGKHVSPAAAARQAKLNRGRGK